MRAYLAEFMPDRVCATQNLGRMPLPAGNAWTWLLPLRVKPARTVESAAADLDHTVWDIRMPIRDRNEAIRDTTYSHLGQPNGVPTGSLGCSGDLLATGLCPDDGRVEKSTSPDHKTGNRGNREPTSTL